MNRKRKISLIVAAVAATALTCNATLLSSVNFYHTAGTGDDNYTLASSDSAGVQAGTGWYNVQIVAALSGEPDNLVSGIDIGGGLTLSYSAGTAATRVGNDMNPVNTSDPNEKMMASVFWGNKTNNGSSANSAGKDEYFQISGLTPSQKYTFILYFATEDEGSGNFRFDDGADGGTAEITASMTSFAAFDGTFVERIVGGDPGNYGVVEDYTMVNSTVRVTMVQSSGAEIGLAGFQVIAIPEPGVFPLLAIGAVVGRSLRRRR